MEREALEKRDTLPNVLQLTNILAGSLAAIIAVSLVFAYFNFDKKDKKKPFKLRSESSSMLPSLVFRPFLRLWFGSYDLLHSLLPPDAKLQKLVMLFWISDSVRMAAVLGISDALLSGPMTVEELLEALPRPVDKENLQRLLRALVPHGLYQFNARTKKYSLTRTGALLCSQHPDCALPMVLSMTDYNDHKLGWKHLEEAIRKGGYGFHYATGGSLWEFYDKHPELSQRSDLAFASGFKTEQVAVVLDYPHWHKYRSVVDVGGGSCAMAFGLTQRFPHLKGHVTVLDRPIVHKSLSEDKLKEFGVSFQPGSFFEEVSPVGADCYVLKHILHDWNDEQALQILSSVRKAMLPHSVLVISDMLIEGPQDPLIMMKAMVDMQMMAMCGGKERTREEWDALLAQVKLKIIKVHRIRHLSVCMEVVHA